VIDAGFDHGFTSASTHWLCRFYLSSAPSTLAPKEWRLLMWRIEGLSKWRQIVRIYRSLWFGAHHVVKGIRRLYKPGERPRR
jgi:hypothetical protein